MQTEKVKQAISANKEYAIVLLDPQGKIESWNKGACEIFGYEPEEAIGNGIGIFFEEEDIRIDLPARILHEAAEKGTMTFEGPRLRNGGQKFWAEVVLNALYGNDKELIGFSAITKDVTSSRRQKEFDRRNLHALINNTRDLMWSIDREYNLITSNEAFDGMVAHMCGSRIEPGSCVLADGFTREQITRYRVCYDRAFSGDKFSILDFAPAPFEQWSEISFQPIMEDGEVAGVACHAHDITSNIRAEQKIKQLNRLYELLLKLNRTLSRSGSEPVLFDRVCKLAVESGQFKRAWIANVYAEDRKLELVAACGLPEEDIPIFNGMTYYEGGVQDRVINTGIHYVSNDVENDEMLARWRQYSMERGLGSCITLPIKSAGVVTATFNLATEDAGFFNEEEVQLLTEAARDISFAVEAFENERLKRSAEEKLKNREARLKHAQEVAHLGSWELDMATGTATWSEELCRIYGLELTDNMHSYESWLSFIHPDDVRYVLGTWEEGMASQQNFSSHYRIVRIDGTVRYIYNQNHLEFDKNNALVSVYGTSLDITEMMQAEDVIRKNASRLKQAQEVAHFGSWELGFKTGKSKWSDEACRIYGLATDDNVQTYESWLSFIHPEDAEYVAGITTQMQETLTNVSFYHRILRRDGTVRHLHSRANYEFDVDGKPVGLFGVVHDITDQVHNIQRLQVQNEQLEDIAWIQSHKVRGPLATILGLAKVFKSGDADVDIDFIVDGILESSEQLDKVIHDIVGKTATV